ncbi:MAG: PilZ domain-containing protein [Sphingomonas sp.]
MGVEGFETSAAGKRTDRRARVLLSAKLHTPQGEHEARLRDISRSGALIESPALVKAGGSVVFERGNSRIPSTVAWSDGYRIGLAFEHPIDEGELLVHINRAKPPAPAPVSFSRPGIGRAMSGKELRMAQAWSVAVGLNLPES